MDENNNYFNHINKAPSAQKEEPVRGSGKGVFIFGMVAGAALTVLVLGIAFLCGSLKGLSSSGAQTVKTETGSSSAKEEEDDSLANDETMAKIASLEAAIDKYFYLDRVDNDTLRNGIYKGLMDALGDPYTEYYTPEELNDLLDSTEGIYYGIGAYVSIDSVTSLPKISGIIDNSPAQDANLRANDIVYEADGKSLYGMSLTEAVSLIKGPEGTQVTLTIYREGEPDYLYVTLTRRQVEAPTVKLTIEEDIARIQVTEFDEVTVDQFSDALTQVKESDVKGLILDLRANPGGNLSTVVSMCQMILPKGLIVYTEDGNGNRKEYKSDGRSELQLPLVVLVDGNSASASEIMAGAIKDYGIGTLVGTTTYGKGIVQQIVPFRDGSAIKITISAYYTPSGKNIHGIGIEPDVVCEFDSKAYYDEENPVDNQLEKAKEVLREKMK